ncbi:dTDP-4-dehydrorhamnose 3,5-epimerase family protein [Streptomyces sp. WMMC940]|uniref:dTDP-4-dehydrorhamnose 3,5-epimerase family protein n=1 Tax=Streptomyces sp. WMMC940 TaxID=3015153 RepID=UPI0022B66A1D|nr:dTDP-4-dehydrorhamnose 3,5-epimerase [Streptomyces sp. WMMC940]MCZ7458241.1 dTDP-4-dehydrorhamnose 3,5-epimerase [Streptomyces sp. WMMC940]
MAGRARPLSIPGAWRFDADVFQDERGSFHEWFSGSLLLGTTGADMAPKQANCSVSRQGALRGISVTPGHSKVVTCTRGAVLDVVVDLRVGSPTFGRVHMERLDEDTPAWVYISEGLGHCFLSLVDGSTLFYLLSGAHDPAAERRINPLDPEIGIGWPAGVEPTLSPKDEAAPGLTEALRARLLPAYAG